MAEQIEKERRWLIYNRDGLAKEKIDNFISLVNATAIDIELVQSYFTDQSGNHQLRLRASLIQSGLMKADSYVLCSKTKTDEGCLEVEEFISRSVYKLLFPISADRVLRKTRKVVQFKVPDPDTLELKTHKLEFDFFHDHLEGLVILEIEYEDEAPLLHLLLKPLVEDITDHGVFWSNSSLSRLKKDVKYYPDLLGLWKAHKQILDLS
jgi:CYTH domain-containing protein